MSSQPPPQVSPDGRYYWDGRQWVPVAQPALPQPAPPQPPAYAGGYGAPATPVVYQPPTNGMATASLVFGILSWFVCPIVGAVIAVVCGHTARGQIRRTGEAGAGLATAGLVLGYLHLVAWVVVAFFWIVVLGGLATLATLGGGIPSPSP